jgi:hypothetical protein
MRRTFRFSVLLIKNLFATELRCGQFLPNTALIIRGAPWLPRFGAADEVRGPAPEKISKLLT